MRTKGGLYVSETFLSIQGEGPTMGRPAVFLRLKGCNFQCSFCDTIPVHSKGDFYAYEKLATHFRDLGYLQALRTGARLVITGGNPMLQQADVAAFLRHVKWYAGQPHVIHADATEVETQASHVPDNDLAEHVGQWNVSPKLANSGMSREKRIVPEALRWHSNDVTSCFKFVVKTTDDLHEVLTDFVVPYTMNKRRVWLMPMASTRNELSEVSPKVAEMAVRHGLNFSPRLQLVVWDKATGV